MISTSKTFASVSTNDVPSAATFYRDTLGLDVAEMPDSGMGAMAWVTLPDGNHLLVYPKDDHEPATHTFLNFAVSDFDATADELRAKGVTFEKLEWTDDDGVVRDPGGNMPPTAWFRDPAGNWICLMQGDPDAMVP